MKMKKMLIIPLSLALLASSAGTTFAEQKVSAFAVQNVTLQPVAQIATTTQDSTIGSIQRQLEMLQFAIVPTSPRETIDLWVKAVDSRNGALQFALFSPEMKKAKEADFDQSYWVTGGSSPWIKNTKITELAQINETTKVYLVAFDMATSGGDEGTDPVRITVKKIDEQWYIHNLEMVSETHWGMWNPVSDIPEFISSSQNGTSLLFVGTDYTITLPSKWKDQLTAVKEENQLIFYYQPKVKDKPLGNLFSIETIPVQEWKEKEYEATGFYRLLGEKSGYVYALHKASEIPYATETNSVEYKESKQILVDLNGSFQFSAFTPTK